MTDVRSRIVVFGDVIDDIVVRPATAIRADTDTAATIERRSGGSAANTAAWLGSVGWGAVDFVGRVSAADVSRHSEELRTCGVAAHLIADADASTGTIVVIAQPESGIRTMLTDRGASAALDPAEVPRALFDDAVIVHCTGHVLLARAAGARTAVLDEHRVDALHELVRDAHAAGARVSIGPGSAGFIADVGADRFLEAISGADVLIPNQDEALLLAGSGEVHDATRALAGYAPLVVTTRGDAGVTVAGAVEFDADALTLDVPPVDPTGAGDAFTAGFLARWAAQGCADDHASVRSAVEAGLSTAVRALQRSGARPPR